jgi:hypothetical protein
VTFTAVSSNPAIVPNPTITGTGGTRTLNYQPAANANGVVTITVTANDGQSANNTFSRKFTITVNPKPDADLIVTVSQSSNPAGTLRNQTYAIAITNSGPDAADNVVVTATIPTGTTFVTSDLPPLSIVGNKVTWNYGTVKPGLTMVENMVVFVNSGAPSVIVSTAQVSSAAQDANLGNNVFSLAASVVAVGTFEATMPETVSGGEHTPISLTWTVPGGSWHVLNTVDLRLSDEDGTALWVRFDEATRSLSLIDPDTGKAGPAFAVGSASVLSNQYATLYLAGCRVQAAGPTSPTVTLTLDVTFKHLTLGRKLLLEIAATDDLGNSQGFDPAGVLFVRPD